MSLNKDEARRRKKARTISVERSSSSGFFAEDGAQTSSDCSAHDQYVTTLGHFSLKQVKAPRKDRQHRHQISSRCIPPALAKARPERPHTTPAPLTHTSSAPIFRSHHLLPSCATMLVPASPKSVSRSRKLRASVWKTCCSIGT